MTVLRRSCETILRSLTDTEKWGGDIKSIKAAQKAARKAIESLYDGVCSVIEYQEVADRKSKLISHTEATIFENQPCRLSFTSSRTANQTETAAEISQNIKLFIAPELNIKAGSKIIVTQNDVTAEYSASGCPAVYATHQEISLTLFKEWA